MSISAVGSSVTGSSGLKSFLLAPNKIFFLTFFGMIIGLLIGVIAVFLQSKYGFFMITESLPYPVEFRFLNLLIVILTITVLGFIAAKIASSRINKEFIER